MSQHLHMSNWMAVGASARRKEKDTARQVVGKKSPKPDSYKTVMCQAWLECKVCIFGENCRFAHGESELRPSKVVPKQNSKYKTKLCDKYTTTGLCPYGSRCLFIHPDNGNNAYIRPDKLIEVTQRHALADMNAQKMASRPVTPDTPLEPIFGSTGASSCSQSHAFSNWPLDFFSDKNDNAEYSDLKAIDFKGLFRSLSKVEVPGRGEQEEEESA